MISELLLQNFKKLQNMKHIIKQWIIIGLSTIFSALICHVLYSIFLIDIFKLNLMYPQWLAILIIVGLIIPRKPLEPQTDDSKRSKISQDLFKNGI